MESKMEGLLTRFESLINRFEQAQGSAPSKTTSSAAPAKAGANSHLIAAFEKDVLSKVKAFEENAQLMRSEIAESIVSKDIP